MSGASGNAGVTQPVEVRPGCGSPGRAALGAPVPPIGPLPHGAIRPELAMVQAPGGRPSPQRRAQARDSAAHYH